MVYDSIKKLVAYGVNTGLVEPEDEIYVTNRLLEVMELDEYEEPEEIEDDTPLEEILKDLLDEAYASGVLEDNGIASRDLPGGAAFRGDPGVHGPLCEKPRGGNGFLLQIQSGYGLHPPLPDLQGHPLGDEKCLWRH